MKTTPMIFNGDMVRALLEGRKVQTRRPMKIQPDTRHCRIDFENGVLKESSRIAGCWQVDRIHESPYGSIGDLIWLRETCKENLMGSISLSEYAADKAPVLITGHDDAEFNGSTSHWWYSRQSCPSIHMPRWASRLTLKIKNVRVERLQDISEEDAKAEGAHPIFENEFGHICSTPFYRYGFIRLWNSIYNNWDENLWVWVYDFEVIKANVDDVIRRMAA